MKNLIYSGARARLWTRSVVSVWLAAVLLVFGLLLAGCGGGGGDDTFDGSTLTGTNWEGTHYFNMDDANSFGFTVLITMNFISDTEGKRVVKVKSWSGDWSLGVLSEAALKAIVEAKVKKQNGTFIYTYDAETHTGVVTTENSTGNEVDLTITVDVSAKTFITDYPFEDGTEQVDFTLK